MKWTSLTLCASLALAHAAASGKSLLGLGFSTWDIQQLTRTLGSNGERSDDAPRDEDAAAPVVQTAFAHNALLLPLGLLNQLQAAQHAEQDSTPSTD